MYTFTLVAALCAGFAVAQDLSAIAGLPDCGVRSSHRLTR